MCGQPPAVHGWVRCAGSAKGPYRRGCRALPRPRAGQLAPAAEATGWVTTTTPLLLGVPGGGVAGRDGGDPGHGTGVGRCGGCGPPACCPAGWRVAGVPSRAQSARQRPGARRARRARPWRQSRTGPAPSPLPRAGRCRWRRPALPRSPVPQPVAVFGGGERHHDVAVPQNMHGTTDPVVCLTSEVPDAAVAVFSRCRRSPRSPCVPWADSGNAGDQADNFLIPVSTWVTITR